MSIRFEDSFWGEKDEGFGVLLARIKQGKATAKEILEVVAKRAAIEEEYCKSLSKLAKGITAKVGLSLSFLIRPPRGGDGGDSLESWTLIVVLFFSSLFLFFSSFIF